jgi:hypothetical protein
MTACGCESGTRRRVEKVRKVTRVVWAEREAGARAAAVLVDERDGLTYAWLCALRLVVYPCVVQLRI